MFIWRIGERLCGSVGKGEGFLFGSCFFCFRSWGALTELFLFFLRPYSVLPCSSLRHELFYRGIVLGGRMLGLPTTRTWQGITLSQSSILVKLTKTGRPLKYCTRKLRKRYFILEMQVCGTPNFCRRYDEFLRERSQWLPGKWFEVIFDTYVGLCVLRVEEQWLIVI